jgi:hypothetical protein
MANVKDIKPNKSINVITQAAYEGILRLVK